MGTCVTSALVIALGAGFVGCADPFIEATTALLDTPDTQGPYQVWTTVVGARDGDSVELRYQVDGRDPRRQAMRRSDDGGLGSGELFLAGIPGQLAGATVRYHVVVTRNGEVAAIDPPDGPVGAFVFSVTP